MPKKVITVRTAAVPAVGEGGSSPIVTVDAAEDPDVSQFKGTEIAQSDWPEQNIGADYYLAQGACSARPRTSRPISSRSETSSARR